MIVVDTTVWVDFFRGRDLPHVRLFTALLDMDEMVSLTDVVLTEILQGLRTDADVRRVEQAMSGFDVLRLESLDDYRRAADLYRTARRRGVTVRKTVDCLIASVCVREWAPLLHADRDFDLLASCTELEVFAQRN